MARGSFMRCLMPCMKYAQQVLTNFISIWHTTCYKYTPQGTTVSKKALERHRNYCTYCRHIPWQTRSRAQHSSIQRSMKPSLQHMSYIIWLAKRTWIPYKEFRRGLCIVPIWNSMSTFNMALVSITVTVAHMTQRITNEVGKLRPADTQRVSNTLLHVVFSSSWFTRSYVLSAALQVMLYVPLVDMFML